MGRQLWVSRIDVIYLDKFQLLEAEKLLGLKKKMQKSGFFSVQCLYVKSIVLAVGRRCLNEH